VLPGDGVAQRAAQPIQDRGLQQELVDMLGLALQDLLGQVVDDVAVVPGEAGDEAGDVVSSPHRQRGQLERGDPAFGASLQRSDIPCRQRQSHHPVEVRRGLVGREAQVGGSDLDQLIARPQASQGQLRVLAGADHQVHLRREVLEQEGHAGPEFGAVDEVVVVQHQVDVVRDGAELVDHRGQDSLDRWLARLQERKRTGADAWSHRLQGRDHGGPERGGLAVALLQGQPRHRPLRAGGQPLSQQRRLAEAGRSRDEREA
jgi:hypothetical protein